MSKVDAQRAMREAKYARIRASGPTRREAAAAGAGSEATVSPAPTTEPAPLEKVPVEKGAPSAPAATGELCGHKSMNGRTCSRELGHSEKSHRYS